MMPSSIFQPASAGLREGPSLRAGTVQPVKSLPLKSGFHGSADCSDAGSTKQSSVTMLKEMPFIGIFLLWNSQDVERGLLSAGTMQKDLETARPACHVPRLAEHIRTPVRVTVQQLA